MDKTLITTAKALRFEIKASLIQRNVKMFAGNDYGLHRDRYMVTVMSDEGQISFDFFSSKDDCRRKRKRLTRKMAIFAFYSFLMDCYHTKRPFHGWCDVLGFTGTPEQKKMYELFTKQRGKLSMLGIIHMDAAKSLADQLFPLT